MQIFKVCTRVPTVLLSRWLSQVANSRLRESDLFRALQNKRHDKTERRKRKEGEIGEGRVDEVEKVSEGTSVQRGREDEEEENGSHRTG